MHKNLNNVLNQNVNMTKRARSVTSMVDLPQQYISKKIQLPPLIINAPY